MLEFQFCNVQGGKSLNPILVVQYNSQGVICFVYI